ncbi:MAG TPA: right-handed parallel beta-helix repeat-containing protein [Burkholderiales bacterium]|nr:right-handed parallel beta-helix repeat-containing protein [Burkholderiales bacterium]
MKARHSLACTIAALSLVALHARADSDQDRERDRDRTTTVDCAAGDTVARALRHGDERKSLTILINGSCSEHVVISRSDIKLAPAAPGATISGPDPTIDVIRVTGTRVTIDGITVTGGRNGITADGAAGLIVQNAVLRGTGRNGITYAHGASGVVDNCTVLNNARDGVAIESAAATVINSQVNQNGRMGVGVFNGGSARIGVDNFNVGAGNTISANASNGIHIVFGSTAIIAMNQITGNGTSDAPGNLRIGVNLASATADFIGGNTISGNAGTGVNLVRSSANFGDANFGGITTVNTITGNGNPVSQAGVVAFNGSSVTIRDAVISNNVAFGVVLSFRSSAQIGNNAIQNNVAIGPGTGDGIRLVFGSGLFGTTPNGAVTGNAGFGLNCTDGESSVINIGLLGIGANTLGGVGPTCTGF